MYWDESPAENKGRAACVWERECVQCKEGCSILDKNSLKGKRTSAALICSVSVFHCHALRSHPLLSLPLLICPYSTPPPSQDSPDTFHFHFTHSAFYTCISFQRFHHILRRHLFFLKVFFSFTMANHLNHTSMEDTSYLSPYLCLIGLWDFGQIFNNCLYIKEMCILTGGFRLLYLSSLSFIVLSFPGHTIMLKHCFCIYPSIFGRLTIAIFEVILWSITWHEVIHNRIKVYMSFHKHYWCKIPLTRSDC